MLIGIAIVSERLQMLIEILHLGNRDTLGPLAHPPRNHSVRNKKRQEDNKKIKLFLVLHKLRAKSVPELVTKGLTLRYFAGKLTRQDRKSTRLNSSHVAISYAVF